MTIKESRKSVTSHTDSDYPVGTGGGVAPNVEAESEDLGG